MPRSTRRTRTWGMPERYAKSRTSAAVVERTYSSPSACAQMVVNTARRAPPTTPGTVSAGSRASMRHFSSSTRTMPYSMARSSRRNESLSRRGDGRSRAPAHFAFAYRVLAEGSRLRGQVTGWHPAPLGNRRGHPASAEQGAGEGRRSAWLSPGVRPWPARIGLVRSRANPRRHKGISVKNRG